MQRLAVLLSFLLAVASAPGCARPEWPRLWTGYSSGFMDDQVRVIDRDAADRTTSEGQAYAMFFALVANDRARFDRLVRWTELNLASGSLPANLPAWLWGRDPNGQWGVLDANSASDADVWMAYTLLEAGHAWKEPRYTQLGSSLAARVAEKEVAHVAGVGTVLLPGPSGFHTEDETYRLNASYLPLQLFVGLSELHRDGPWAQIAERIPALVRESAPNGFATDWISFSAGHGFSPSALGSYDAIRVYLWAGMLDPQTPGRDAVLQALPGMARYLRANGGPPAKVGRNGIVTDATSPVGFRAALLPYLAALGEKELERAQLARVRSELQTETGLYGQPPKYYDQNLALFGLGSRERQFRFDARGRLVTSWADR